MGLHTAFINLLASPKRIIKILWMKITLIFHLLLSYFPFVKNYNVRKKNSNIPQPAYYNSWKDIKTLSTILSLFWVTDLS